MQAEGWGYLVIPTGVCVSDITLTDSFALWQLELLHMWSFLPPKCTQIQRRKQKTMGDITASMCECTPPPPPENLRQVLGHKPTFSAASRSFHTASRSLTLSG